MQELDGIRANATLRLIFMYSLTLYDVEGLTCDAKIDK